jgi:hypothetical protein
MEFHAISSRRMSAVADEDRFFGFQIAAPHQQERCLQRGLILLGPINFV